MSYETLSTAGFLYTQTGISVALLKADFGDGYGTSALIGSNQGLRTWAIKIDALPDNFDYVGSDGFILLEDGSFLLTEDNQKVEIEKSDSEVLTGETRAEYLWQFFLRSKVAGNLPFWVWDLKTNQNYLAEFVDDELTYEVFCYRVYGAGLQLRQRRVRGVKSPVISS
jgi:hypothetical protein